MRARFAVLVGAILAAGGTVQAQPSGQTPATPNTPAQEEAKAVTLPSGTAMKAELNSSVDSRKVKVGEKVEAHTTEAVKYGGKVIVPKGAKLEGHVTEATARSKGDSGSTLAIQFDKAIAKKGEEISLNVAILAIAAPQSDFSGGSPGPGSDPMGGLGASAAGGSPMGASRPQNPTPETPGYPGEAAGAPLGSTIGANGSTQLTASSRGVYGLKELKLMAASSSTGLKTVITSSGKNVRLASGTRLLLLAQTGAPATPDK